MVRGQTRRRVGCPLLALPHTIRYVLASAQHLDRTQSTRSLLVAACHDPELLSNCFSCGSICSSCLSICGGRFWSSEGSDCAKLLSA